MGLMLSKIKLFNKQGPESDVGDLPTSAGDPKLANGGTETQEVPGNLRYEQLCDDEGRPLPHWREQVTIRALFAGACISVLFCILVLKCAHYSYLSIGPSRARSCAYANLLARIRQKRP